MTVSADSRRREYQGNGVTTIFNGPMAFQRSHVQAFLLSADGLVLVPPANYDVERLGQEAGTRVIMHTAPPVDTELILLRTMPYTQEVDVTNQGAFHAETIEKGYDALAMQIQQLDDSTLQLIFDGGEFVWDARGHRIIRVGDARDPMDAVNLRSLLLLVEQIIGGGGSVGVNPKTFQFTGDGEQVQFWMEGADIDSPEFYDTYIETAPGNREFIGQEPVVDYVVELDIGGGGAWITFSTPPGDGVQGFAVLRGYARPYIGPPPMSWVDARTRIKVIEDGHQPDIDDEFATLIYQHNMVPGEVVIQPTPPGAVHSKLYTGSYFSIQQEGVANVSVVGAAGVTIQQAADCLPRTRVQGSLITCTCIDGDLNRWAVSGDMAMA